MEYRLAIRLVRQLPRRTAGACIAHRGRSVLAPQMPMALSKRPVRLSEHVSAQNPIFGLSLSCDQVRYYAVEEPRGAPMYVGAPLAAAFRGNCQHAEGDRRGPEQTCQSAIGKKGSKWKGSRTPSLVSSAGGSSASTVPSALESPRPGGSAGGRGVTTTNTCKNAAEATTISAPLVSADLSEYLAKVQVASRWSKILSMKVVKQFKKKSRKGLLKCKQLTWAVIRDPTVLKDWADDIKEAAVHFLKWIVTGFKLFRHNVGTCFYLSKRLATGYNLNLRERRLLVRTTADCLKLIPFSFFIIVPFAELALPLFLRIFPNMLPSTFFEKKYDNATLARKFLAKQQMAEFMQQVVAERTQKILDDDDHKHADKAAALQEFEEKLVAGHEFPSMDEIQKFSRLFKEEMKLSRMNIEQLRAISKMCGLSVFTFPAHLQLSLRHHINALRREDRDYLWEGIGGLTHNELIEACKKRAIRFHDVTELEMRRDLARWLELSANRNIPTLLLLWIQSFYLRGVKAEGGDEVAKSVDPSHFHVPVEEAQPKLDPHEAFHNMEERWKARSTHAETKLKDLKDEIDEVWKLSVGDTHPHPQEHSEEIASEEQVSLFDEIDQNQDGVITRSEFDSFKVEERLQDMSSKVDELVKALAWHNEIINRQQKLLNHQLEFMAHMKDNMPKYRSQDQDAGTILLDQRVRLVEMLGSFSKDTDDIEKVMSNAPDTASVARERTQTL